MFIQVYVQDYGEQFDPVDFRMQNVHAYTKMHICMLVWACVVSICTKKDFLVMLNFSSLGSGQKLQPWQQDSSHHPAAATVWSLPTEICQ